MQIMSRVAIACFTSLLLAGCMKSDKAAKDSAAAAAAAMPAPAPAPAPTNYSLTATADTAGWFITFPSGLKVPLHVAVSGDSVIESTGTFASQRRKGVKVMTEGSLKMQNGKLLGTTIAHYSKAGPDSVLRLRVEGTKKP